MVQEEPFENQKADPSLHSGVGSVSADSGYEPKSLKVSEILFRASEELSVLVIPYTLR